MEQVLTLAEYQHLQQQARIVTCSACPVEFAVTDETLRDGNRYFCCARCHEHGTALMDHRVPPGDFYGAIAI